LNRVFKISSVFSFLVIAILLSLIIYPLTSTVYGVVETAFKTDINFSKDNSKNVEARETYHREIDAEDLEGVSFNIGDGIIAVTGCDGYKVLLDAEFKVSGKKLGTCEKLLEKTEIDIRTSDNEIEVEVNVKDKRKYDAKVFLYVQVPRELNVHASVSRGLINIRDIDGRIDLGTKNGDITCDRIGGGVSFFTLNGSVFLKDISGDIEGFTVNGGITCEFRDLIPEQLEFTTGNGITRLDLHRIPDAIIEAKSTNGFIHVSGMPQLPKDKYIKRYKATLGDGKSKYELKSLNGSIILNIFAAE